MGTWTLSEICTHSPARRLCCLLGFVASLIIPGLATAQQEHAGDSGNVVLRRIAIIARQGVAVDQNYFYAISNTSIVKCEKDSAETVAAWHANAKEKSHAHFTHLNSGTVIEGKLYCAHSRYPVGPNDNSVEIWNVQGKALSHERSIPMPGRHGSLTWIDRHKDGSWWMCYAVYGKTKNKDTRLVKYEYQEKQCKFIEREIWSFPRQVVENWENMSCSGGSWGPDGLLYTTGHDHAKAYVLAIDENKKLKFVRTETGVGFFGQAIAWDRSAAKPVLWGIVKKKDISLTLIPTKKIKGKNRPSEPRP